jgi:hypothetical protein
MNFIITAKSDFSKIFTGVFELETFTQLILSKQYYLILANFDFNPTGSNGLDIFKVLNKAFFKGVPFFPEEFMLVQEAGFFTFSKTGGSEPAGIELKTIFPTAPLPVSILKTAKIEYDTASFWMKMQLSGNVLFSTLLQVGVTDDELVILGVLVNKGSQDDDISIDKSLSETIYIAKLPDIRLLQLFQFNHLQLSYRFSENENDNEYSISGTLIVDIFGVEFVFKGDVISNKVYLHACIALSITSQNSDINGTDLGMTGVVFTDLIFAIDYQYAEEKTEGKGLYRVQGGVNYAGLDFTGQLYLANTTPVLASVYINQALDVGQLFSDSIPGFNWPTQFVNIVFKSGSRLYYLIEDDSDAIGSTFICQCPDDDPQDEKVIADPDDLIYSKGFNLYAIFDITLFTTIRLKGNVTIATNGVVAKIQLVDPIDIFVLQLYSPDHLENEVDDGPIFSFDSDKNEMGFDATILLLHTNFGAKTAITATRSEKNNDADMLIKAKIKFSLPVLPDNFSSEDSSGTLDLSYSKPAGFKVENWPELGIVDDINKIIDFKKEIQSVANKVDKCKAIGNFVKEKLTTDYKVNFDIKSGDIIDDNKLDDKKVYLVLSGTFMLSVMDAEIFSLDFPQQVNIELPNSATMAQIPDLLVQAIVNAAAAFVAAIFNDPQAIAMFLSIMAGEKAADYALSLACKDLVDDGVPEATEAGSTAFTRGGGFGIGGGFALLGLFGAVFGAIDNVLKVFSCFIAGTQVLLTSGKPKLIEQIDKDEWLVGHDGCHNQVLGVEKTVLGDRALFAINDSGYFVTSEHPFMTLDGWKSIDPQATLEENSELEVGRLSVGDVLVKSNDKRMTIHVINRQSASAKTPLYNLLLSGNNSYFADDFLVHNKDPKSNKLLPPEAVVMIFNQRNNNIELSWSVARGAQQYVIELQKPAGLQSEQKTVDYTDLKSDFGITTADIAGRYVASLTSKSGEDISDSTQQSIYRLLTPDAEIKLAADDAASLTCPSLIVDWQPVEMAASYVVAVTQNEQQQSIKALDTKTEIEFSVQQPAGEYQIAVSAMGQPLAGSSDILMQINSLPSEIQSWLRLTQPEITGQQLVDEQLVVTWTDNPNTDQFVVRVTANEGEPQLFTVEGDNSFSIDLGQLAQGTEYVDVDVIAMPDSAPDSRQIPSVWSAPVTIELSLTPLQIAQRCFAANIAGAQCGETIITAYPQLEPNEMADVMAQALYPALATGEGLKAAYPDISADLLTHALIQAYGEGQLDMQLLADSCYKNDYDGIACAHLLAAQFTSADAAQIAQAMANAGYAPEQTAAGLKSLDASITATHLAHILKTAYETK